MHLPPQLQRNRFNIRRLRKKLISRAPCVHGIEVTQAQCKGGSRFLTHKAIHKTSAHPQKMKIIAR